MNELQIEEKRADERLGPYLTRAREARGLSIEELAIQTKLSLQNAQWIEAGDWTKFPIEAYLRSYLRTYCDKLGLDTNRVLDWYGAESGKKFASLLAEVPEAPKKIKPVEADELKPKSKGVIIALLILLLAFAVVSYFFKNLEKQKAEITPAIATTETSVEEFERTEISEGAIAVDSLTSDSLKTDSTAQNDTTVSQAAVEEAVKKSELPASATIFISSSSAKKDTLAPKPQSNGGQTKFELIGSGEAVSWVGLKRHLNDDKFAREANIAKKGIKMVYQTKDSLHVVIGEPKAISALILNGVQTPLPAMKNGRVTRFCVYDGKIVSVGEQ